MFSGNITAHSDTRRTVSVTSLLPPTQNDRIVAQKTKKSKYQILFGAFAACHVFLKALREGKRCVTAHWLNTVLKRKKMVPPLRTLHLPFAFPPGAKPCSQHVRPAFFLSACPFTFTYLLIFCFGTKTIKPD